MKEVSGYNISEQEFKKVSKWAEEVYNIVVIVDYFVSNQLEIEECYNLALVIKNLRNNADLLNAFFIVTEGKFSTSSNLHSYGLGSVEQSSTSHGALPKIRSNQRTKLRFVVGSSKLHNCIIKEQMTLVICSFMGQVMG